MNITYEKCGEYLVPNLSPDSKPEGELRKFGLMRKSYRLCILCHVAVRQIKGTSAFHIGIGRNKV